MVLVPRSVLAVAVVGLALLLGGLATSREPLLIGLALLAYLLARRDPLLGVHLALVLVPFQLRAPGFQSPLAAVVLATLLAWVISGLKGEGLAVPAARPLVWAAALLAVAGVSVAASPAPEVRGLAPSARDLIRDLSWARVSDPLYVLTSLVDLAAGIGLACLVVARAATVRALLALGDTLVATHVVSLALALADHAGLLPLQAFRPRDAVILISGFPDRMQGMAWHPSWFAQILVIVLPLVWSRGMLARGRVRIGWWALWGLTILGLALSYQRGGWIAGAAGMAWTGAMAWRYAMPGHRGWGVPAAGMAVLLCVGLALLWFSPSHPLFRRMRQADLTGRENLWAVAIEMARDRPLLGHGHNSFGFVYLQYRPTNHPMYCSTHGTAHNAYLQMVAGCGAIGLVVLSGLLVSVFRAGHRALSTPDPERFFAVLGALGAVVGYLVYALVQEMFYVHALAMTFWVLAGLIAAARVHS